MGEYTGLGYINPLDDIILLHIKKNKQINGMF